MLIYPENKDATYPVENVSNIPVCITPERKEVFTNGTEEEREALNAKTTVFKNIRIANTGSAQITLVLSYVIQEPVAGSDPVSYTEKTIVQFPCIQCPANSHVDVTGVAYEKIPDNAWVIIQTDNANQVANVTTLTIIKSPAELTPDTPTI